MRDWTQAFHDIESLVVHFEAAVLSMGMNQSDDGLASAEMYNKLMDTIARILKANASMEEALRECLLWAHNTEKIAKIADSALAELDKS